MGRKILHTATLPLKHRVPLKNSVSLLIARLFFPKWKLPPGIVSYVTNIMPECTRILLRVLCEMKPEAA